MANTDKQNFRYPRERWQAAMAKVENMQAAGYDIDMTMYLSAMIEQFIEEGDSDTAVRLELVKGDKPARPWRRPYARTAGGDQ